MQKPLTFLLLITFLFCQSCLRESLKALDPQKLFSISYGNLENQIDCMDTNQQTTYYRDNLCMRDGFFYIANGKLSKVMKYSSYGELLMLLYHPQKNPKPALLTSTEENETTANNLATKYPFNNIGCVAISSQFDLYIEDKVSKVRQVYDEKIQAILDRLVYQFDKQGKLVRFIGQEGVGGSPFPPILSMHVNQWNDLIIICRSLKGWYVYVYNSEATLLYKKDFLTENLPVPKQDTQIIPKLQVILPDFTRHLFYFKIDYEKPNIAAETKTEFGQQYLFSSVYLFNIQKNRFEESFKIPINLRKIQVSKKETKDIRMIYDLIGITAENHLFFLAYEDTNLCQLLILETNGKVLNKILLRLPVSDLRYNHLLHLNAQGILTAMIMQENEVQLILWRTDQL